MSPASSPQVPCDSPHVVLWHCDSPHLVLWHCKGPAPIALQPLFPITLKLAAMTQRLRSRPRLLCPVAVIPHSTCSRHNSAVQGFTAATTWHSLTVVGAADSNSNKSKRIQTEAAALQVRPRQQAAAWLRVCDLHLRGGGGRGVHGRVPADAARQTHRDQAGGAPGPDRHRPRPPGLCPAAQDVHSLPAGAEQILNM